MNTHFGRISRPPFDQFPQPSLRRPRFGSMSGDALSGGADSKQKKEKKELTASQKEKQKAQRRKYAEAAKRRKELRAQGLLPPAKPRENKKSKPKSKSKSKPSKKQSLARAPTIRLPSVPLSPRAKLARQPTVVVRQFSSSKSRERESNRRKALVPYVSRQKFLAEIAAKVPKTSSAKRRSNQRFAMVPYVSRAKMLKEIAEKTQIKPKSKSKSKSRSGPPDYKALSEACNEDLAATEGRIAKLYDEQAKLAKDVRKNLAALIKNVNALAKRFPAEEQ